MLRAEAEDKVMSQLALEMEGIVNQGMGAELRIWMWPGIRHLLRTSKGALFTSRFELQEVSQTFGLWNYKITNMSNFMTQMCGNLLRQQLKTNVIVFLKKLISMLNGQN